MKIAVVGPQNTGKTTFIKDFLKEFTHFVSPQETYRNIIEKNNLKINQETTLESQRDIRDSMIQIIYENTKKYQDIIFDRCIIDNYIYTKYAVDKKKIKREFLFETWKFLIQDIKNYDYIFFIPTQISITLVNDDMRDIDVKFIDTINKEFIALLLQLASEYKIKVKVISGNRKERIRKSQEIIMGNE